MVRKRFMLLTQPIGSLYRDLLDYARVDCTYGLLVLRDSIRFSPGGKAVLDELSAFLWQKAEVSEWPGTQLFGHTAWVFKYWLEAGCVAILKRAAEGLYDWQQPALPEDLCLLRKDESPWLTSIAHEHDSYFELLPEEKTRLLMALPLLESIMKEDDASLAD